MKVNVVIVGCIEDKNRPGSKSKGKDVYFRSDFKNLNPIRHLGLT